METKIVNLRTNPCDFVIGRNGNGTVSPVPEQGFLGNPFSVTKYGRNKCIALFKSYFLDRIEKDPEFRTAVLALRGKTLGCFCKPKACHGDIIKEWLDSQPT